MENGLQPQMVRPQLYISSLRTELCRDILEQNGITHILQVGFELQPSHPQHFKYLQLPVYDMPEQDIVAFFPQAFDFIDAGMGGGGGVLVHCQAGISRSATIVIAYCMAKEQLSADAATAVVAAARSRIWPNNGFKCQLEAFELLGCDASRWEGWSMNKFLSSRYGDESVDFMAAMLGGAPQDRCAAQRQQRQQQQGEQQVVQLYVDEELLASPFAGQRADAGAAHAPRAGSSAHRSCTAASGSSSGPLEQGDSCVTDQRPGSCSTPKSPHAPASSPERGSARLSDTVGGGSCCRGAAPTGPRTTRRMSCAVCTGGPREGGGGGGHRLRRHSTGQYPLAAAAAGVTAMQLGALGHLQLSSGGRLPEEAALLMAG